MPQRKKKHNSNVCYKVSIRGHRWRHIASHRKETTPLENRSFVRWFIYWRNDSFPAWNAQFLFDAWTHYSLSAHLSVTNVDSILSRHTHFDHIISTPHQLRNPKCFLREWKKVFACYAMRMKFYHLLFKFHKLSLSTSKKTWAKRNKWIHNKWAQWVNSYECSLFFFRFLDCRNWNWKQFFFEWDR